MDTGLKAHKLLFHLQMTFRMLIYAHVHAIGSEWHSSFPQAYAHNERRVLGVSKYI